MPLHNLPSRKEYEDFFNKESINFGNYHNATWNILELLSTELENKHDLHMCLISLNEGDIFNGERLKESLDILKDLPENKTKVLLDTSIMWEDSNTFLPEEDFDARDSYVKSLLHVFFHEASRKIFKGKDFWTLEPLEKLKQDLNCDAVITLCCFPSRLLDALELKGKSLPEDHYFIDINRGFCEYWNYRKDEPVAVKDKNIDIILTGAFSPESHPARTKAVSEVFNFPYKDFNSSILGRDYLNTKHTVSSFNEQHIRYLKELSKSKLSFVGPSILEVPVPKYYESMGAGSVVVTPKFIGMEKAGLIPDETCLIVSEDFDWVGEIEYLLKDTENIERIRNNAWSYFEKNCTYQSVVDEIVVTPLKFI